ncbi:PepSY domain-containing protein [Streptomyces sp. NPDC002994]|uniref:PepSY domain-containing protein n=1 Tax=Streptomyces sp. NPDC002994 TaxID=3154441 RepID=UPI0033B2D590
MSHEPGDDLHAFTWRARGEHGDGPERVDLEVDRRTGSIVYFSAARADGSTEEASVTREEAMAAASAVVSGGTTLVSAEPDTWDRPRWRIVLDRSGEPLTPDLVKVTVDAVTGKVIVVEGT